MTQPVPRKTQHRPRREDAKGIEARDLHKKVNHLERLVARLRKRIAQLEGQLSDTEEFELVEPIKVDRPVDHRKPHCIHCDGTNLKEFAKPNGSSMLFCVDCKKKAT